MGCLWPAGQTTMSHLREQLAAHQRDLIRHVIIGAYSTYWYSTLNTRNVDDIS